MPSIDAARVPWQSAAARKEQYRRAEFRIARRLLASAAASAHRGCARAVLGSAFAVALAA
eukprot:2876488-Alexandrium_andersonii.AAC.1